MTSNHAPRAPNREQYKYFKKEIESRDYSLREAAMILAHMLHETNGLTEKEERDCRTKCARGDYTGGWAENIQCETQPSNLGKCYCGRGYLQVSSLTKTKRDGNG